MKQHMSYLYPQQAPALADHACLKSAQTKFPDAFVFGQVRMSEDGPAVPRWSFAAHKKGTTGKIISAVDLIPLTYCPFCAAFLLSNAMPVQEVLPQAGEAVVDQVQSEKPLTVDDVIGDDEEEALE